MADGAAGAPVRWAEVGAGAPAAPFLFLRPLRSKR